MSGVGWMPGEAGFPVQRALCGAALLLALSAPAAAQCQVQKIDGDPEVEGDYGRSVSIAGDVLVIGDPKLADVEGKAEVFRRKGSEWVLEAVLHSGVVTCANAFAQTVATDGVVVVVGDPGESTPECLAGAVYVYRYDGAGWPLEVKLTIEGARFGHAFGYSVDLDEHGQTILVGARDVFGPGAAYVFRYDGAGWIEEAKLQDPGGEPDDLFGTAVSISGDAALVGDHAANGITGAAFVFRYKGGEWAFEQELIPFDSPPGQISFGLAVTLAGDTLLVGAPQNGVGSAYVFHFDGVRWVAETKLIPAMPVGIGPLFGRSVALRPEARCIIGSRDWGAGFESGAAYLFRDDAGWIEVSKFTGDDTNGSDLFGVSVALDGDIGVVGAVGNNSPGAAYVFAGLSGTDCNANRVPDGCDILEGASDDVNGNDVPDECESPADVNGDGVVDVEDLVQVALAWGACAGPCPPGCPEDTDGDCTVGVADLVAVVVGWG
jgi:hypothetical protein